MRVFLVILLTFTLTIGCANAEAQRVVVSGHGTTAIIAVFGDSLAAGYGLPPQDALPAQLEVKLKNDGIEATVLNDGVSGDTTAGGRARVATVLAQKPDLVVLIFGGNDLLRGLPVAAAKDNLNAILNELTHVGIRVLLVGQKAPLSLGAAYSEQFNAMYVDLAAQYHVPLFPSYLGSVFGNSSYMQNDGIHPSKAGVEHVLTTLEPEIMKLAQRP